MCLMRQMLGGGPLIKAEVKIFAILIFLEGFPRLNATIMGMPWIIRVRYLG